MVLVGRARVLLANIRTRVRHLTVSTVQQRGMIQCEKCHKWGCPNCTHLPADIHTTLGNWPSLHWYCQACEPAIEEFCRTGPAVEADKDITRRGHELGQMKTDLENKMKEVIASNEQVAKSYAQTLKTGSPSAVHASSVHDKQPMIAGSPASTTKVLDEYTDRERRKGNLVLHNIPENDEANIQV